jgi:DNA-binding transcriptional LysR family regulator
MSNEADFQDIIALPLPVSTDLLYYFVLLVITENFNAAAHTLGITPQGLNKAIDSLENILKFRLIERENGYKGLTLAGKILFAKAQWTFENIKNLNNSLLDIHPEKNELISIAWSKDYYPEVLPDILAELINKKPGIFFKVHLMSGYKQVEALISYGFLDLGLMFQKPSLKTLAYTEGRKIPYIIAGKPQPVKNWYELDYISLPLDNKGEFLRYGEKYPKRTVHSENSELDFDICESTRAATFVLESRVKGRIDRGTLAEVALPPEKVYITPYLVFNKNITMTASVRELVEKIKLKVV